MKRTQVAKTDESLKDEWTYNGVPAVRELLDQIAKELAEEYLRLIQEDPEAREIEPRRKPKT